MMEFVIWGAGKRGKIAAEFIGYENIKAFIDSDNMLQGTEYQGIPIVDFGQYIDAYRKFMLLVSPYDSAEIVEILEQKGIDTYFLFSDCPSEIYSGQLKAIDEINFPELDYNKIVIVGISLFSLLLWEYLSQKGFEVPLLIQEDELDFRTLPIKNIYYEKSYTYKPDNIIVQTRKQLGKNRGLKTIDLYRLAGYVEKFNHPELQKFKNLHKGKRCFIIGNGSSLTVSDLNKLARREEICFAMNGIPFIFGETFWRPDYYVCEDDKAMEAFGDSILHSGMNNIMLSDAGGEFLGKAENHDNINIFHTTIEDYMPSMPSFSNDITKVLYCGYTVTYVCIQIAIYMGFQEIYLLGVDFDYADGDTTEMKHFTSKYHSDKDKINPCRRDENLLAYYSAQEYACAHGVKVYNATRGGKLEVFERIAFDNIL